MENGCQCVVQSNFNIPDEASTWRVEFGNTYAREIESFSNSVLTGAPVEVPASEAVQVQRIMEAAYRSNDEGKIVTLA